jgi:hypothetical protein
MESCCCMAGALRMRRCRLFKQRIRPCWPHAALVRSRAVFPCRDQCRYSGCGCFFIRLCPIVDGRDVDEIVYNIRIFAAAFATDSLCQEKGEEKGNCKKDISVPSGLTPRSSSYPWPLNQPRHFSLLPEYTTSPLVSRISESKRSKASERGAWMDRMMVRPRRARADKVSRSRWEVKASGVSVLLPHLRTKDGHDRLTAYQGRMWVPG